MKRPFPSKQEHQPGDGALVVPLETLDRTALAVAGGKAANLGELIHEGFPIRLASVSLPRAYAHMSACAGLDTSLSGLEAVSRGEAPVRSSLLLRCAPPLVQAPLAVRSRRSRDLSLPGLSLGKAASPSLVRSSATAEDLPDASFAGQQETFLNVIGIEAVLTAIQQCFASLWTDRATQYRASRGIAQDRCAWPSSCNRWWRQKWLASSSRLILSLENGNQAVIDANPWSGRGGCFRRDQSGPFCGADLHRRDC